MTTKQKRWLYAALILCTIPLGLATRWRQQWFPDIVDIYGGDVLSATCIFFGFRFLWPQNTLIKVGVTSYLVCVLIELQQLYQAPWAVKFRSNVIVGILLGHGFLWSDLVCYGAGVIIGCIIALFLEKIMGKMLR